MKSVALTAFPRTLGRRAGSKKLRSNGRIPAVIYGRHNPPQSLELELEEFKNVLKRAHSEIVLVDLAVKDDAKPKRLALVQSVQHHVLSHSLLHVDLHEVADDEKVTVMVPVEATGDAAGVKTGGGTLETVLHKLKVRALPKDLPETIIIDVTSLEIGKAIHIGDLKPADGVEILGDKHISVVAVAAPVSEAEEAASLEASATPVTDVEMTKEKKEDGTEPAAKGAEKGAPKAAAEKAPAAGDKAAEKKPAEKKK